MKTCRGRTMCCKQSQTTSDSEIVHLVCLLQSFRRFSKVLDSKDIQYQKYHSAKILVSTGPYVMPIIRQIENIQQVCNFKERVW